MTTAIEKADTATRPVINSANPSFLLAMRKPLRDRFDAKYGRRDIEWTAYFVSGDCASIKDEFGGCWYIDVGNKQVFPA